MLFVAYFHFVKKCKPYRVYTVRCYMLRFLVTVTIYLSFSNAVARFGEPGRRRDVYTSLVDATDFCCSLKGHRILFYLFNLILNNIASDGCCW